MKTFLLISIVTILALGTAGVAEASLSFTANIGGVPSASGVTTENFNGASPSILTLNANSALRTGANYSVVYTCRPITQVPRLASLAKLRPMDWIAANTL